MSAFGSISIFGLCLTSHPRLAAAPLNDHFANRIVLAGAYAPASGSTLGATVEPGEPNPAFGSGTLWWSWTAPASGRVEIRLDDSNYEPVSVYTGGDLHSLMLVTGGFNPSFDAVRGTAYQLQVARPPFSTGGPLSFSVALIAVKVSAPTNFADFRAPATLDIEAAPLAEDATFASVTFLENDTTIGTVTAAPWRLRRVDLPVGYRTNRVVATDLNGITTTSAPVVVVITPSHDDFANRIPLAGASVNLPTLFAPATSEPGEPLLYTNIHRVWYSWTAPHNGVAAVWPEGQQQFNTDIFRGETLQTLTRCLTDHAGLFRIEEGQVYQIGVAGWFPQPVSVQSILRIEAYHLAVNENFASRLPLPGASVTVPASNFTFAALEPGEPRHVTYGAGRSVWWTWTAPESGVVSLRTTGHTFTTAIAAYTGTDLATLAEVAAGAWDPVGFYAFAGANYQIAVDAYYGQPDYGFFDFHLDFTPLPRAPNDDFANRLRIDIGTIHASNTAATRELGEPIHRNYSGQRSVWYTWTAPGFGRLSVSATSVSFNPIVAVYTGSSLAALATPTGSGSDSSFHLLVQPGVEYQIAVDGMVGGSGPFELALDYAPPPGNDNFANRITIQGFPAIQVGTNTFATAEPDEPRHAHPNFNFTASVWYTWTAPVNGLVTADVRVPPEQSFDWKIVGVYTGSAVDALTLVVNGAPSVTWQAQQGVIYQIAVDGYQGAPFTLRLLGPPPNNDFADRTPLTGASNLLTASNVGATLEPVEPAISTFDPGGRSVWWTWIAPADGEAELRVSENVPGPDLQPLLGIYSGTTLNGLSLLARSRNGRVRFFVNAEATYQIQVDGSFGRSTQFILSLHLLPPALPLSFDLANVRRLADGRVQLPVFGRRDDYIILEASSDLQTWQEIDREALNDSFQLFIAPPPVNQPRRFYRMRNLSAGGDGY